MEMDTFIAIHFVFLVIPGLYLILGNLYQLSSMRYKGFYMTNDIYTGRIYAKIPFGIAFILFAIATIPI